MKKMLASGIALLSVIPTTFAQTATGEKLEDQLLLNSATNYGIIDNRHNPMNTPKGTVEGQYPSVPLVNFQKNPNIATSIDSTRIFDIKTAQEAWKQIHCAMLVRGFVWNIPTANYAHNGVCGTNLAGATLRISNPQLEYQRKLVEEYIAKMNGQNIEEKTKTPQEISYLKKYEELYQFLESIKTDFADYKSLLEQKEFTHISENKKHLEDLSTFDKKIFEKFKNHKDKKIFDAFKREYFQKVNEILLKIGKENRTETVLAIESNQFPMFNLVNHEYKDILLEDFFMLRDSDNSNNLISVFGLKDGEKQKFAISFQKLYNKEGKEISFDDYNISVRENALNAKWNEVHKSLDFEYIAKTENIGKEYIVTMVLKSKKSGKEFEQDVILLSVDSSHAVAFVDSMMNYLAEKSKK